MSSSPRPSLDHFIGRVVKEVEEGSEDGQWSITLDGGIVISNKDSEVGMPDPTELDGKTFCMVILGELDTQLCFGNPSPNGVLGEFWVSLSPTRYTLAGLEGQTEEIYPQMPEELESVLPPDPSSERIVDGPVEPQEGSDA